MRNSLDLLDRHAHFHPQTDPKVLERDGPIIFERGNGVTVTDSSGRSYIEGMASLWCATLGFTNPRLAKTAHDQILTLASYHTFNRRANPPAIELSEKLLSIAPMSDGKVSFCNSGSEAVDTMIKLAWLYQSAHGRPRKRKIISRHNAYHGSTVMGATLSGLPHVRGAMAVEDNDVVLFAAAPYHYRQAQKDETPESFTARMLSELDALIQREGPENIAAMIVEPVMGAGGVIIPPEGYYRDIEALLRRHDILLLSDEVICGFGRTGHWFGCQAFGFTPDMMSVAKGLSSGYQPIGATLMSGEIYQAVSEEAGRLGVFGHGFTYAGHPVTSAVALETLRIYDEIDLLGRVRSLSKAFLAHLHSFSDHALVGETRGIGMIGALELVADKVSRAPFPPSGRVGARLIELAMERGIILRNLGDVIAICPPLVIEEAEIATLFSRLSDALADLQNELLASTSIGREVSA